MLAHVASEVLKSTLGKTDAGRSASRQRVKVLEETAPRRATLARIEIHPLTGSVGVAPSEGPNLLRIQAVVSSNLSDAVRCSVTWLDLHFYPLEPSSFRQTEITRRGSPWECRQIVDVFGQIVAFVFDRLTRFK
jgi:hypothetical protein